MYRPLPECLTIKPSTIHGNGLFATQDIPTNKYLGISHVYNEGFPQSWIRTPLGGFYNHSEDPNCYLIDSFSGQDFVATKILITLKKIPKDTELTCKYTLYSPEFHRSNLEDVDTTKKNI